MLTRDLFFSLLATMALAFVTGPGPWALFLCFPQSCYGFACLEGFYRSLATWFLCVFAFFFFCVFLLFVSSLLFVDIRILTSPYLARLISVSVSAFFFFLFFALIRIPRRFLLRDDLV